MNSLLIAWNIITSFMLVWLWFRVDDVEDDLSRETKKNDGNFKYIYNGMSTLMQQIKHLLK